MKMSLMGHSFSLKIVLRGPHFKRSFGRRTNSLKMCQNIFRPHNRIAKMLRTVGSLCQPSLLLAVTTDDTRLSRMKRAVPDGTLAGRVGDENGSHYVLGHLPRPRQLLVCVHAPTKGTAVVASLPPAAMRKT